MKAAEPTSLAQCVSTSQRSSSGQVHGSGSFAEAARTASLEHEIVAREGDDAAAIHQEYVDVVREVSETTTADLLDAAAAFSAARAPQRLLMRDGIHLTDKGHRLMATLLTAQLTPVLTGDGPGPDTSALAMRAHEFMKTDEVR